MKHLNSASYKDIPLKNGIILKIFAESEVEQNTLICLDNGEALDFGEEPIQLLEGCGYEYCLPVGFEIYADSEIIKPSRVSRNRGRLEPNIYVGRLLITILRDSKYFDEVAFEVRSIKVNYRSEYRTMLEDITVYCTELLMIHSSPVTQKFVVDYDIPSRTLYQRFALIKSIVDSDEFRNAIHRIIAMPITRWKHQIEERDIRRAGRIVPTQLRLIASQSNRMKLLDVHPLYPTIESVPTRLTAISKTDTVDTPENRFVKHALQVFQNFCAIVQDKVKKMDIEKSLIFSEAEALKNLFGEYLNHSIFREISKPEILPLNSPVLQRKEGYREILRVWLMFDLAAKLCWNALDDDQYHAGKRDIATLYEYWVFFKLLDIVKDIFSIEPKQIEKLIQPTSDGMGLQLRQGQNIALFGETTLNNRRLRVCFHYNQTFSKTSYPYKGSWTQQMRPDYTLSLWPAIFKEDEAERQELIVHIHFDAKYKVADLKYFIDIEESGLDSSSRTEQIAWQEFANKEKLEQKKGTYKRADLLKMHAYKDAIRRTAGAYVIYPGPKTYNYKGFHEIIPGLGAFSLSPSNGVAGVEELRKFIVEVVQNLTNRASQREELSYYIYDVNRKKTTNLIVHEMLPEKVGSNRVEPIKAITVLIGYYQQEQYEWITKNRLYNIRVDKESGLEKYGPAETGAKYLLLHGPGKLKTNDLWKITSSAPILMSKEELIRTNYPNAPSKDFYLVYSIEPIEEYEFGRNFWDVRLLRKTSGYGYSTPFAVSLLDLAKARVSKY